MDNRVTRIPVTVNPSSSKFDRTQRAYSSDFPTPPTRTSFVHDSYDKMSQRIRQFEEDCRLWRERVFNNSKLGKPSSVMLSEQPRLMLDSPNFPEFPSDWQYSSSSSSSQASAPYRSYIEQDINGKTLLKMEINVGDFPAENLNVRTEGSTLIISGEREVVGENSSRREQFNKEITIPDFADRNNVKSYLTPDGQLIIESAVIDNRLTPGSLRGFISYPSTSQTRSRTETRSGYTSSMSSVANRGQPVVGREVRQSFSPPSSKPIVVGGGGAGGVGHQEFPVHAPSVAPSAVTKEIFSRSDNALIYKFNLAGFNVDNVTIEIRDGIVIIHAKFDQTDDTGKTYREFRRELKLPEQADAKALRNSMSQDGVLTVEVPLKSSYHSGDQLRTTVSSMQDSTRHTLPGRSTIDVVKERSPMSNDLKLSYDLSAYRRDNIQIKVTGNVLTIFAPRLEGRTDHDFEQRYNLPNWADGNSAKAKIGNDGNLTIEIPRKY